MADILIRNAAPYYLMRGLTEAGRASVKERSTRLDDKGEVNIGAAGYASALADAKTLGLTVVEQG